MRPSDSRPPIRLQPCADGPVLVRGAREWTDADGVVHPVTRPIVAVCRCGRSSLSPWCDGTHKLLPPGSTASGVPGRAD